MARIDIHEWQPIDPKANWDGNPEPTPDQSVEGVQLSFDEIEALGDISIKKAAEDTDPGASERNETLSMIPRRRFVRKLLGGTAVHNPVNEAA